MMTEKKDDDRSKLYQMVYQINHCLNEQVPFEQYCDRGWEKVVCDVCDEMYIRKNQKFRS